jgi:hypothetical protein
MFSSGIKLRHSRNGGENELFGTEKFISDAVGPMAKK